MLLKPLPAVVLAMLQKQAAPSRLVAHLTIVHDVACKLIELIDMTFLSLAYDRESVRIGAAIHDIGKTVRLEELSGPGTLHEDVGPSLLLSQGWPEHYTRYARTHARWQQEEVLLLEDLLVAFADTIWKGKRDSALEQALVQTIAEQSKQPLWSMYMQLDDIASELAKDAHERVLWQGEHSIYIV